MKISLPVMLIAALTLCGCNGGNSTESESSSAVTTTAAETTSVTSTAATTAVTSKASTTTSAAVSTDASAADSSDEAALVEAGIVLPEVGDTDTSTEDVQQFTFPQSEDDAPIELPIIPIG